MTTDEQRNEPTGITPAALNALLSGDLVNAKIAMTPGGIEAQEAAGQQEACRASRLPIKGTAEQREVWESFGVIFGEPHDDQFVNVQLPAGWHFRPTEHSMWSELTDSVGRVRASMFYKAAFYDRHAHIRLDQRFDTSTDYDSEPQRIIIVDCKNEIHEIGAYDKSDYHRADSIRTGCDYLHRLQRRHAER